MVVPMLHKIEKIYLIAQVAFSVLVILFGVSYGIRCLVANQIFCALGFGMIGYVSGYRLLFKASMAELREYKQRAVK